MLTKEMLLDFLSDKGACSNGLQWLEKQDGTLEEIYNVNKNAQFTWGHVDWLVCGVLNFPDPAHDIYTEESYETDDGELEEELWQTYLQTEKPTPWSEIEAAILERMKEAQASD